MHFSPKSTTIYDEITSGECFDNICAKQVLRKYFNELIDKWDNSSINLYDIYPIYKIVKYINDNKLNIIYNNFMIKFGNGIISRSSFYPLDNYLMDFENNLSR